MTLSNATQPPPKLQLYRANILNFDSNSGDITDFTPHHYDNGALVVAAEKVVWCGNYQDIDPAYLANAEIIDYQGKLIVPGLIDTHTHSGQLDVIASYGEQLLDWLHNYTFASETQFADHALATFKAEQFIDAAIASGTTTAAIFATVHEQATDAVFEAAAARNFNVIAGKVMMDRGAPKPLLDCAQSSYDQSARLINKWHNKGRAQYAITPRFAITSTEAQLEAAQALATAHPDVHIQTHISENPSEIQHTLALFNWAKDYLDVYERYQLVRSNTLLAHGVYLSDSELARTADNGASIVFCPSSNLFLGSGLLNLERLNHAGVATAIASDVGAGTSLSMIKTMAAGYQVGQLQGQPLDPYKAFFMATLGNAHALGMQDKIGSFAEGKFADFVVIDDGANSLLAHKNTVSTSLRDKLFDLMILGDENVIAHTYLAGEHAYSRPTTQ